MWAEVFGEDRHGIFAECSVNDVRFVWRWICRGSFQMGSPKDEPGRWEAEGPKHKVTLSRGFWLGETPVTQAQWQAVMGENPSYFKGPGELPVEQVTWPECKAFAEKLNALFPGLHSALPTEAQWEYACRAGTETALYTGGITVKGENNAPELDEIAWYGGNSGVDLEVSNGENSKGRPNKQHPHTLAGTHRVKLKKPNAWGLHDMLGNVWEWCADEWDEKAYAKRAAGATDPFLDSTDESAHRVLRGGSWGGRARGCRSACRGGDAPGNRFLFLGLRLAAGQNEPSAAEPLRAERTRFSRKGGAAPGGRRER